MYFPSATGTVPNRSHVVVVSAWTACGWGATDRPATTMAAARDRNGCEANDRRIRSGSMARHRTRGLSRGRTESDRTSRTLEIRSRRGRGIASESDLRRDERLAVSRLARALLPRRSSTARVAPLLRLSVRDGGAEQLLLSAPRSVVFRSLARGHPRRVRHGREGQPILDAHQAPPRAGGAARAVLVSGEGARPTAGARPIPAAGE